MGVLGYGVVRVKTWASARIISIGSEGFNFHSPISQNPLAFRQWPSMDQPRVNKGALAGHSGGGNGSMAHILIDADKISKGLRREEQWLAIGIMYVEWGWYRLQKEKITSKSTNP